MNESIFSYTRWRQKLPELTKTYQNANPYPHIVLDNLLEENFAKALCAEFPAPRSTEWIYYSHINEKKLGKTDFLSFGPTIKRVIEEFNSPPFISFLSELTGIRDLIKDESLEGGGLHQSEPGGYLNIHADFTVHPHHKNWQRRVNLLLYLNQNWQEDWKGYLELWDRNMIRCAQKIAPIFNRCVIFNTDADAFHGHPEPLACPPNETRKSLALYYFTKESNPMVRSTEYRARPTDNSFKGIAIYLDKMALRSYDFAKRRLGMSDKIVNKLLKLINRLRS